MRYREDAGGTAVVLEPLRAEHLTDLAALWSDARVIRYTNILSPLDREAAKAHLRRLLDCQRGLSADTIFSILGNGCFCGISGCPPVDGEKGNFGLFYQLLPAAWGKGMGQAAAGLTLEKLKRLYPNAVVYADVAAENTASVHILKHFGFVRTTERPGVLCRDGRMLDILYYVCRMSGEGEELP